MSLATPSRAPPTCTQPDGAEWRSRASGREAPPIARPALPEAECAGEGAPCSWRVVGIDKWSTPAEAALDAARVFLVTFNFIAAPSTWREREARARFPLKNCLSGFRCVECSTVRVFGVCARPDTSVSEEKPRGSTLFVMYAFLFVFSSFHLVSSASLLKRAASRGGGGGWAPRREQLRGPRDPSASRPSGLNIVGRISISHVARPTQRQRSARRHFYRDAPLTGDVHVSRLVSLCPTLSLIVSLATDTPGLVKLLVKRQSGNVEITPPTCCPLSPPAARAPQKK